MKEGERGEGYWINFKRIGDFPGRTGGDLLFYLNNHFVIPRAQSGQGSPWDKGNMDALKERLKLKSAVLAVPTSVNMRGFESLWDLERGEMEEGMERRERDSCAPFWSKSEVIFLFL